MLNLKDFLKSIPEKVSKLKSNPNTPIKIVLGNESCDLDSAVCSVILSHHLNSNQNIPTLPFFNIPQDDVPLRTEVIHCLGSENVEKIPTRDDLDLLQMTNLKVVLVDHHVLPSHFQGLLPKVEQIIDHRTVLSEFDPKVLVDIQLVGSCSTLIANQLLKEDYKDAFGLKLLRDTILVDTSNLCPKVNKATPKDVSTLEEIEAIIDEKSDSRESTLVEINTAKMSIEGFSVDQLMRKDLKRISIRKDVIASVPSIVISVSDMCRMEGEESIENIFEDFCEKYNTPILIVFGINKQLQRDIGFYLPKNNSDNLEALLDKTIESLLKNLELNAEESPEINFIPRFRYLKQGNISYSRKKILPIIIESAMSSK